ncbi:bifunctional proline dehydrogenase/L-glutamate gamma-semialdehyde dehydrogenase PutA [Novosphingobium sp.]|uniref:bifunctional proline dehydrogenase/L-glutamate gamma-semialdehyde dehydrogenase PutA n=1 Tax=Novosphingobium sp. TaxID=1874826 RepID=UPI0022C3CCA3|nr:bifunctional proline dehydrogenase/L-glutamate gamma-semialdehyde dehydrogenase PutA [Novosphingobium sp.]MCZ8019955.1 bifunctional proline dehydrogenase/L-glutamate gamma-semialdehyde dehydrogenase PutA [Novosphingobium sp.]MCZ8035600.1 bifunctional proline dehydrogenase/L-glutamate gamma-semialdehyde dehydrogenase PutA [Novosphingobium sp.]MCZ8052998.1 bifunctional proline dehydrogenase/L-glutamate gamma-semialdehyde dehydrogenase PutA [Novosphingobium sp.]MCZ8060995.1 bifunctional proline
MPAPIDRSALCAAYRQDEEACIAERLRQAAPASAVHPAARRIAARLVEGARAHKASGLDAFLQTYGLGTDEGIALMCLAEALLRVPDAATADALIHDKLGGIDWSEHLGESGSTFVNAATFSLMLTGQVLDQRRAKSDGFGAALKRAVGRLGEPVIRQATLQAMKILGGQFVFGRTIDEALERAAPERKQGLTHSFDMLGEAAMTFADAERYRQSYEMALERIATEAGDGVVRSPGISVKLSALHPRYDFLHADAAKAALVPMLKALALKARDADIHFTIDAEEAERLELSLDIIEALVSDDDLFAGGWQGFGLALQAYSKRAVPLVDWTIQLARRHGRRIMVRLVKGAYWDSEVKLSQVGGHGDYPVFTRKVATDVSYLACAAKLLAAPDAIYPAFATHNAYTIGAIKALAARTEFEFQRLHGMGEDVYAELAKHEAEAGEPRTPVRIYAPVGGHKELLAYLVRRLLENGANSSFVNRMADAEVPVDELVGDPVEELAALTTRRNPAIPLPHQIFPARRNSAGVDLADPLLRAPLLAHLDELRALRWEAEPTATAGEPGPTCEVHAPHDQDQLVGTIRVATAADIAFAAERAAAAQPGWDALGGAARAELLERAADAFEAHTPEFLSLCQREAGKTLVDAVLELREAVDFLRYYATQARAHFGDSVALPGPTGESNRLTLHGRGVFVTISPWNFPLAIFIGMAAAGLAAGNSVLAKPAEQTPLIAALAVRLCHEAGIPDDVLQLVPGDGSVGALLTARPEVAGVAFTGSTETARAINRALAQRDGPLATLIAETGGQNAMIVDSSALPEQVTRDVVASAFQSAGQRCSALRVLYLQDEVHDGMLEMIRGAFEALEIGNPEDPVTDVGPVIDAEAKAALDQHIAAMKAAGSRVWQRDLPEACANGTFVAPTIIEIDSIADLSREHFGPMLHVARFRAEDLGAVVDAINATGYGLTLGLHSRIDATRRLVQARARVGNFYVNRNQIGAVVESQPFGGEGLSGTGPKAGGPHYLPRFATERVTCIDTTAAGGNASLMAGSPT